MQPEQRPLHHRIARRFDTVQDVYEGHKNRARRAILQSLLPKRGIGAELGVHKGHLTPHLIEWSDATKVYAVDPWYLLGPTWEWAAGEKSTVGGLVRTLRRSEKYLQNGRCEVVIADDCEWLAALPDAFLDWVYLDSSHMYEHTVRELALLEAKVKPDGIVAGDDWQSDPSHRHHGVTKAVRESVAEGRFEVIFTDDTTHQWAARVSGSGDADQLEPGAGVQRGVGRV
jgi:hypothetical protein